MDRADGQLISKYAMSGEGYDQIEGGPKAEGSAAWQGKNSGTKVGHAESGNRALRIL